jgi:glycosyltransferase 2 family protein
MMTRIKKHSLQKIAGYMIALACMVWVFHDIHMGDVMKTMTGMNWWWVPLAVMFDILSYFTQGLRWKYVLRPLGKISSLKTTQAVYAGLFTNEILPLRIGELVRMYLVSRWLSVRFVSIIPSLVVERFFDGIWLTVFIGLAALFVPLPEGLLDAEEFLGAIVIIITAVIAYLTFRKEKTISIHKETPPETGWKVWRLFSSFIERLSTGIHDIGVSRYFYLSLAISSFVLIFQIIAFWLIMRAYNIHLNLWAGAVVLLIVHFGTSIPNAPSNVGTYQFFTVVGLALFGVEKTIATGFSIVVFLILTVPLWVIGLFAIGRTGMSLSTIRNEIKKLRMQE